MAEFLDSFDDRVSADWAAKWTSFQLTDTATYVTVTITSAAGRNGTNGLRITRTGSLGNAVGVSLYQGMPVGPRYKLAFARRWSTLPPSGAFRIIAVMRDSGTIQCELRLYSDGSLQVWRNATALVPGGASATGVVAAGTFHHFEWDLTVHNTAGAGSLVVDGVVASPVFSFTGQNTRGSANNQINEVGIRMSQSSTSDGSFTDDTDDVVIHDVTAFIGDCRVGYFKPSGAGTYSAWTANGAASLYDCVDDNPNDGDTTYTSSSTVGQKESFTFEDVPTAAVIKFAQHVWVMKKTDAGAKTIAPVVKSGGSESLGTDVAPTTSYAFYRQANNIDPATGVTWTPSGFNSAEFGEQTTS